MIRRYRPTYQDVEAVQLCWQNWNAVCDLLEGAINEDNPARNVDYCTDTCGEQGPPWIEISIPIVGYENCFQVVRHGEWIVRDINGVRRYHTYTPERFEQDFRLLPWR